MVYQHIPSASQPFSTTEPQQHVNMNSAPPPTVSTLPAAITSDSSTSTSPTTKEQSLMATTKAHSPVLPEILGCGQKSTFGSTEKLCY